MQDAGGTENSAGPSATLEVEKRIASEIPLRSEEANDFSQILLERWIDMQSYSVKTGSSPYK